MYFSHNTKTLRDLSWKSLKTWHAGSVMSPGAVRGALCRENMHSSACHTLLHPITPTSNSRVCLLSAIVFLRPDHFPHLSVRPRYAGICICPGVKEQLNQCWQYSAHQLPFLHSPTLCSGFLNILCYVPLYTLWNCVIKGMQSIKKIIQKPVYWNPVIKTLRNGDIVNTCVSLWLKARKIPYYKS